MLSLGDLLRAELDPASPAGQVRSRAEVADASVPTFWAWLLQNPAAAVYLFGGANDQLSEAVAKLLGEGLSDGAASVAGYVSAASSSAPGGIPVTQGVVLSGLAPTFRLRVLKYQGGTKTGGGGAVNQRQNLLSSLIGSLGRAILGGNDAVNAAVAAVLQKMFDSASIPLRVDSVAGLDIAKISNALAQAAITGPPDASQWLAGIQLTVTATQNLVPQAINDLMPFIAGVSGVFVLGAENDVSMAQQGMLAGSQYVLDLSTQRAWKVGA